MNSFDRQSRDASNALFSSVDCHQWDSMCGPSTVHGLDRDFSTKKTSCKCASEWLYVCGVWCIHTKHLKRFDTSACYNVSHFSLLPAFLPACILIARRFFLPYSDTILLYHIHIAFCLAILSVYLLSFYLSRTLTLTNCPDELVFILGLKGCWCYSMLLLLCFYSSLSRLGF